MVRINIIIAIWYKDIPIFIYLNPWWFLGPIHILLSFWVNIWIKHMQTLQVKAIRVNLVNEQSTNKCSPFIYDWLLSFRWATCIETFPKDIHIMAISYYFQELWNPYFVCVTNIHLKNKYF